MPTEVHSQLVFTKIPRGGYFQYKSEFQIYPFEIPDVPRKAGIKHYPNIMEYVIRDEDKKVITHEVEFESLNDLSSLAATTYSKADRIITLLNTFTNNLFFRYDAMKGSWGIPILDEDLSRLNPTSVWCMQMFYFPNLTPKPVIDTFTVYKGNQVNVSPHHAFYMYEPNFDLHRDRGIVFPSTMHEIFDAYFSLEEGERKIVETAVAYTASAVELKEKRRTLSLLASFTSLETMVNLEFMAVKPERCPTCNQPQYSVSKKFREYLLKYLGDSPSNRKKFNSYYSIRSKIVHTGQQLKTELLWAEVTDDEQHAERLLRYEILQLGKLAIVNWLLLNYRKNRAGS